MKEIAKIGKHTKAINGGTEINVAHKPESLRYKG